ncbi:MAG: S10 family serine carboxypeptidase-like protein, partial [Candidatus Kapaibacteriota bacterium]
MADAEAQNEKKTQPEKSVPTEYSQTPIITKGTVSIKGKSISYTATTGYMNITDDNGVVKATMFYVAYVRTDGATEKRPITFAFNGGPGSSSVW